MVDDFAVVWTDRDCMNHFIHTLTELYQVKVNWMGTKYLGMDIIINRDKHHVTLSMPGYIDKLLRKVCPEGIKSAPLTITHRPITLTWMHTKPRLTAHLSLMKPIRKHFRVLLALSSTILVLLTHPSALHYMSLAPSNPSPHTMT